MDKIIRNVGGLQMKLDKILTIFGVVGGAIMQIFGGWSTSIGSLLTFMVIDFVTGLMLAMIFKNSPKTDTGTLSSKIGFKGLAKKMMIIFFLVIGYQLDLILNTHYIRDGVCIAFICNELVSITENATLMGFPTPSFIVNAIDILKKRATVTETTPLNENIQ